MPRDLRILDKLPPPTVEIQEWLMQASRLSRSCGFTWQIKSTKNTYVTWCMAHMANRFQTFGALLKNPRFSAKIEYDWIVTSNSIWIETYKLVTSNQFRSPTFDSTYPWHPSLDQTSYEILGILTWPWWKIWHLKWSVHNAIYSIYAQKYDPSGWRFKWIKWAGMAQASEAR